MATQGAPGSMPPSSVHSPEEESLFLPDEDPTIEPPSVCDSLTPAHALTTPPMEQSSDEALGQWFRSLWVEELELLMSFKNNSWGTAYQAIASVQVLLRIGKKLKMDINLATHSVSPGVYLDSNGQERMIQFGVLGCHLNGQANGTWVNKLTFFFAVYDFLRQTELATKVTLGDKLWDAREAMSTWGVSLRTPGSFLSAGDRYAAPSKTKLHDMIKQYTVS
jgi:hypothetical protein